MWLKERLSKGLSQAKMLSITRLIFVTSQVCSIVWITWSYIIASYATFYLQQPYPISELSDTVVKVILGNGMLKVIENIFEHNNGKVMGVSTSGENEDGIV